MSELAAQQPGIELVDGQKCYPDYTTITGTVSSSGTIVTGTGTRFETELFMDSSAVVRFPFATVDKGSWNAGTNSPALVGSVGTEGDQYTVSTAGTTNLDGNNSFIVGDKIAFYGGKWIKAQSRSQRNTLLRYKYLYSAANNEIREIIAVKGNLGLIIESAFSVNLSAEDVMVIDISDPLKSISVSPTGTGGIVGTVNQVAVTIDAATVVNFENDAGLLPICVDGTANALQITTQK